MAKAKKGKLDWVPAPDIKLRILRLVRDLEMDYIKPRSVYAYRSTLSKTRAYARIWGLPRLWQEVLEIRPTYIVEVLSQHFDNLSERKKDEVILHELTHIPKNFSGALVPHIKHGKRSFHKKVDALIARYLEKKW